MNELLLASVLWWGAAVADIETTQACLRAETCREANPLMPSSRVGAYGIKGAAFAGSLALNSWMSHRYQEERPWVLYAGAGVQGVFAGLNLRF